MPNEFAPDSYWQALKDRAAGLVQAPIQAIQGRLGGVAQAMPTDPNMRPGVPQEALPGNIDPNSPEFQKRQAIARALMMRQAQQQLPQPPAMPATPVTPENPAGIQF